MNQLLRFSLFAIVLTCVTGCGWKTVDKVRTEKPTPTRVSIEKPLSNPICPAETDAPPILPGVKPDHLRLSYWLTRLGKRYKLDEPLLSPRRVKSLNSGISFARKGYYPQIDLQKPVTANEYAAKVKARIGWVLKRLVSGEYVSAKGGPLSAPQLTTLRTSVSMGSLQPTLHVALGYVALRCIPLLASFHSKNAETNRVSTRYDRNACSTAHNQELIQVIKRWPNGMRLVRTRYAFGWIAGDAPLSPAIPSNSYKTLIGLPRLQLVNADPVELEDGRRIQLRKGILLPPASAKTGERRVLIATTAGLMRSKPLDRIAIRPTVRNLTRRSVLTEAWRYLNTPYGLGGVGNGRDCSRFLLDLFETFNIKLPRHSGWQALAGSFSIDVQKATESQRLMLIEAAAKRGIVLLHFPGHIMMYLGRNDAGQPMAIHSFGEYLKPCGQTAKSGKQDRTETLVRVKKITISDLELGRGTTRKAFIERISRVTVIGKTPGLALAGVARLRPPGPIVLPRRDCSDSYNNSIWISPERPYTSATMRIIASLSRDPGPVNIALIDPDGKRHTPTMVRLGGPPYGFVASIDGPKPGRWRAVLGDGDRVLACQNIVVGRRRSFRRSDPVGPIWRPRRRWSVATENLFSLFVERLFDYPTDKDLTWPNLHTLLRDKSRNILYNHRNLGEELKISMTPDCADLPVALRTYFAWKMRLPLGFFKCRRAYRGRPPKCDLPGSDDNLMSRLEFKWYRPRKKASYRDVKAFRLFANKVMGAIHSSSGRTRPHDEESDLYPVPLTRRALRPGTVFIDPFGHVLTIAKWIPQGIGNKYGILIGVDAQPDGTIGRRRFWRGSFLFHPETKAGGSGFKAWRPDYFKWGKVQVEIDDKGTKKSITRLGRVKTWSNRGLRRTTRFTRFSTQQYRGTQNDFYDTMQSLINPLPLDPVIRQVALVDALSEALSRRVTAVSNGEAHMKKVNGQLMKLPQGAKIFLSTDQAWEAYSTPSRDNRLLISIDSVVGFPDAIKRAPQRFGLGNNDDVDAVIRKVRARLKQELASRSIQYTRSDGSKWKLTLQQVIDRQKGLEMAYNPNDCVEIRWAAPKGSAERSTCKRHAPAYQRKRMETYRHWFSTRKRPPN